MSSVEEAGAKSRRGRREHRKHVTRRDLLAAGRRLFGDQGLYESRIEDLSKHAGVAKGTLYGYFANKTALIEAVVTTGFSELLGHVHREAQGAENHAQVVARLADAHLEFFEENPDLMRIFHQVRGLLKFNRPENLPLRRVLEKYLAGLAHVLALNRPASRGHDRKDLETATVLFGAVSGIASTRTVLTGGMSTSLRSRATIRALVAFVLAFESSGGGHAASPNVEAGVPAGRVDPTARRGPRAGTARGGRGDQRPPHAGARTRRPRAAKGGSG